MRKTEIADANAKRIAVQKEIQGSSDSRYVHRLHGVLLCCKGHGCRWVAEALGRSPATVSKWVRDFERGGFDALRDAPRPGRPAALGEDVLRRLGRDLRRTPRDLGYRQNLWDGKVLSHHLREAYGVRLGVRQCQRLFGQLGFRQRKPRPVIAKADAEAQADHKKKP